MQLVVSVTMELVERKTMDDYYARKLNAARLFGVYDTALPAVRRYLDAEIGYVRSRLRGDESILELGAGYGRIVKELAPHARSIVGVDISVESVELGREYLRDAPNARLETLDVRDLSCVDEFDVLLCLQNGLSAMNGRELVPRWLRALQSGGTAFFSSYSPKFWEHRVAWFAEQAEKGLIGEIDFERSVNGVIRCRDGFTSTTFFESDLREIGEASGCDFKIEEVDESSVFLVVTKS